MPNPTLLPHLSIVVSLINFTVTAGGLQEQLLKFVVLEEAPEVEERRSTLLHQVTEGERELTALEDKILRLLSESEGMLLDQEDLIDAFREAKETASSINARVSEASLSAKVVGKQRDTYRRVASRGSCLYLAVRHMQSVDNMYAESLEHMIEQFVGAIAAYRREHTGLRSMRGGDNRRLSGVTEDYLDGLTTAVSAQVLSHALRGIFDSHRLILKFLASWEIHCEENTEESSSDDQGNNRRSKRSSRENADEPSIVGRASHDWILRVLLDGSAALSLLSETERAQHSASAHALVPEGLPADSPDPAVLSTPLWNQINNLAVLVPSRFRKLPASICADPDAWESYLQDGGQPPGEWSNVDAIDQLLLARFVGPERFLAATRSWVGANLPTRPLGSLESVLSEATSRRPVLILLAAGRDPVHDILAAAGGGGDEERCYHVSLGRGQNATASKRIADAAQLGKWAFVQNLHLAPGWLPNLAEIVLALSEGLVERVTPAAVHSDFRLILTSAPTSVFPQTILHRVLKTTAEPPQGIRAALSSMSNRLANLEEHGQLSLLIALAAFHAAVCNRGSFGALGFNQHCVFRDADFDASVDVLRIWSGDEEAVQYVVGQVLYGGRMADEWDHRVISRVLQLHLARATGKVEDVTAGPYDPPPLELIKADKQHALQDWCDQLPLVDEPEVFGLHANAALGRELRGGDLLRDALRKVYVPGVHADDEMPQLELLLECFVEFEPSVELLQGDALCEFIVTEQERAVRLVRLIQTSLRDVRALLEGTEMPCEATVAVAESLRHGMVPVEWIALGLKSSLPLAGWARSAKESVEYLRAYSPKQPVYQLPLHFNVQGFFAALLQQAARSEGVSVDSFSFDHEVALDEGCDPFDLLQVSPPEEGALIAGLFIEGARWDPHTRKIEDCRVGELISPMPWIHVIPTQDFASRAGKYECPLYRTRSRRGVQLTTGRHTNFVCGIFLDAILPSLWVLRGCALLCES